MMRLHTIIVAREPRCDSRTARPISELRSAVPYGLVTGGVLALEHLVGWRWRRYMDGYLRPVAYILGTLTLWAGYVAWARSQGYGHTATALGLIITLAGAWDIAAYGLRAGIELADVRAYRRM